MAVSGDIYARLTHGAAALLWAQALIGKSGFLVLDYVNLPIHEAGHLLFGVFGPTLGIWGGTLMQLLVPALFLVYFALRAETTGASFGAFWLGENFLYVAKQRAALDEGGKASGEHP